MPAACANLGEFVVHHSESCEIAVKVLGAARWGGAPPSLWLEPKRLIEKRLDCRQVEVYDTSNMKQSVVQHDNTHVSLNIDPPILDLIKKTHLYISISQIF